MKETFSYENVVIGGGIAGVCCAKELARLHPSEIILLISSSEVITEVSRILDFISISYSSISLNLSFDKQNSWKKY